MAAKWDLVKLKENLDKSWAKRGTSQNLEKNLKELTDNHKEIKKTFDFK